MKHGQRGEANAQVEGEVHPAVRETSASGGPGEVSSCPRGVVGGAVRKGD